MIAEMKTVLKQVWLFIWSFENLNYVFLRVPAFFKKTFRVYHVYCNFILGYVCRSTVKFRSLKGGSLLINILHQTIIVFATETSSIMALTLCLKYMTPFTPKAAHLFFFYYPIMFEFCFNTLFSRCNMMTMLHEPELKL